MSYLKVLFCFLVVLALALTHPVPDSAGIVELPPGLAYGGIPYGSVTGMVADFYNGRQRAANFNGLPFGSVGRPQQPLKPVYYN